MKRKILVTCGDWCSSTTNSHYEKTIIANVRNMKTGERHWIDGKIWKYKNYEDMKKIEEFISNLKLKFGILQVYSRQCDF